MKTPLRLLLILLFLFNSFSANCQIIDVSTCDSTVKFPITEYTSFLKTNLPISVDSATKFQSSFIKASNEPVLVFNYDPYYYWFRIIVKNVQDTSRNLMLLMAPDGIYEGLLFQRRNGAFQQIAHTGLKYRFKDRSYQFTHHVFPFTIAKNSVDTLYVNIDASNAYKSFGFALLKPKDLKIFENRIYFVFGIIVGLLILFFAINICLYFALDEKLHLWYSLYIALLFLVVMKNDLLDQQFLGLDSEKAFRLTPYMTIGALAIAVLMHVVQNFLKDELKTKKLLYKLTNIFKLNVLCAAAVHAFVFVLSSNSIVENIAFSWAKISTLLGICMIIADCAYCVKRRFNGALFILCGSLVFMIGSIQRLFVPSTLSFLFPPTTFHIGIILEVFIISTALIYRQRLKEQQIKAEIMDYFSKEIHDNVLHKLGQMKIDLDSLPIDNNGDKLFKKIEDIKKLRKGSSNALRNLANDFNDESLTIGTFMEQIMRECLTVEKSGAFKIELKNKGGSFNLDVKQHINVFRIIQELLQNAMKYSQASLVKILFSCSNNILSIKVEDNGVGFNVNEKQTVKTRGEGNGLKNITDRCTKINATFKIESKMNNNDSGKTGTKIIIIMPLNKQSNSFKIGSKL